MKKNGTVLKAVLKVRGVAFFIECGGLFHGIGRDNKK